MSDQKKNEKHDELDRPVDTDRPVREVDQEEAAKQDKGTSHPSRNDNAQQAAPRRQAERPDSVACQQQCMGQAQQMGISGPVISQLLQMFGPFVVQALLDLFKKKQELQQLAQAKPEQAQAKEGEQQPKAQNFGLDFSMVTNLLAMLLLQHRTDILGYLSQAEAQLLDSIIAKLQGSQPPV